MLSLFMVTSCADMGDPCEFRSYRDPMCDGGFAWSDGYYNPAHIWIAPHYMRRTVIVAPIHHTSVIIGSPPFVRRRTVIMTGGSPMIRMNGRRLR